MIAPEIENIEDARLRMLGPSAVTVDDAHALELAKFIIFYISYHLDSGTPDDSLECALSRLGFAFLERLPLLAALAVMEDRIDVG